MTIATIVELACYIEDHGWEAVPHYPAVPERAASTKPVADGKVPHDVVFSIRLMAVGAVNITRQRDLEHFVVFTES